MLYYLYSYFNINLFQYLTFRAGLGFFIGFFLTLFLMPKFILWAKKKKANQPISSYILNHKNKKDTPTMGGIVFVFSTIIASLLCASLGNLYVLLGIIVLVGFSFVGFRDDYTKISQKSNAGISAKTKFGMLFVISVIVSILLSFKGLDTFLYLPFLKNPLFEMPIILAISFWVLIFLSTSNAVNLTDGLDGLATVPSIFTLLSLSVFVYVAGNAEFSKYLLYPKVVDAGELFVVSLALIGSLFGFLWYNCNPASVFMGDSGSLALGGFIAYNAIVSHNEILLVLMGSIFVVETLSVILQVGSYKTRKKRLFLMAPIHHHFEQKGWAENKVIVRFWIISMLSNLIALLSLKVR
ncbi:phospho-N-acetylmuramoyl-pentapeptide-transferase [Helicobacter cetorum]|uniref:Phospho-N-acetylmuramoyl-pentapeptide-transferase n=1 Tax=Helicobacter cetorum (strain ATCC BAA-540 / CCUG 52418 / MIT 99-5656) TaxID=1163745 RepID=I0EQX7_HELCM|nr:phospho-N-acetylmuramoyl-pentapeptide-transferase [Helicobacter cetorum]AFI05346.1 phospho-N-acetylmuramoyl-pentapeptide-transferase [Helicobacter cetorum MIT 99-5656]